MPRSGPIVVALTLLAGCSAGTDLGTAGPSFVTVTLDGHSWKPDTSFTALNGSLVTISFTRLPYPGTPAYESFAISLTPLSPPIPRTPAPLAAPRPDPGAAGQHGERRA